MADPIRTYSLTNKQRDLSSALHTVIEKFGGILALFKPAPKATNPKHEWHQDKVGGRGFTVTAYSASTGATVSADDYAKLKVGTRFKVKGYPVIFKVTALEDGNEYKDKLQVMRDDKERGVYVAMVVNEANGSGIKIIGDADFDDCDAFVVDEECFGLSEMLPLRDEDSTTKGSDGISRMVIGEFTFEFRNSKQRICRIANLKAPAAALAEIKTAASTVNVAASAMTVNAAAVTVTQQPAG